MLRTLFLIIMMVAISSLVYAEGPNKGDDNFISSSFSAVFDKLNDYASGEKKIFTDDAKGADEEVDYSRDALGRKVPTTTTRSGMTSSPDEPL